MNQKRKTLTKIATACSIVALAPTSWTKPIVNSVILPVHAQTSTFDCTNSVAVEFFEFDPGLIQFGIDGGSCTLNNEASVKVIFDFVATDELLSNGDYNVTVEDVTGVVANFKFIGVGSGGVGSELVEKVTIIDSLGRSWSGGLLVSVNALYFEVFGEMNLDT